MSDAEIVQKRWVDGSLSRLARIAKALLGETETEATDNSFDETAFAAFENQVHIKLTFSYFC